MANVIFNVARGMVGYYATLPAANDAIIAVPLESSGLETDATLVDYTNLALLLAGTTNEQITMGRKTLSSVVTTLDNVANKRTADADDLTWTSASGNAVGALLLCYNPDTTVNNDSTIVPLLKYDVAITPSGTNIVLQLNTEGFYKSA